MIVFRNFVFLFLLPAVLAFVIVLSRKENRASSFRFSSSQLIKNLKPTFKTRLKNLFIYLRATALVFIIIAMARPQSPVEGSSSESKGIDIVLAIDCSASMFAEDFTVKEQKVNRLDVTKTVVKNFIKEREGDRIGLVSFGEHAYTACPLTGDYSWASQSIERLQIGIEEDATSIGYAMATSLNRLENSMAKTKIIILLTDGRNNAGDVSPQTAAELARTRGVKIYTIGVGSKGLVPYPFPDSSGKKNYKNIRIDLDESTLKQIAEETKGKYFQASDTESLKKVYREINALEKTTVKSKRFSEYKELYGNFLFWGLIALFLEIVLQNTILKTLP